MAAKKNESTIDLKKFAAQNLLVIGAERTIAELKRGVLSIVFIASNCAEGVKATVKQYCSLSKIPCEELKQDDVELGVVCKKPFSISVAGVLKAK